MSVDILPPIELRLGSDQKAALGMLRLSTLSTSAPSARQSRESAPRHRTSDDRKSLLRRSSKSSGSRSSRKEQSLSRTSCIRRSKSVKESGGKTAAKDIFKQDIHSPQKTAREILPQSQDDVAAAKETVRGILKQASLSSSPKPGRSVRFSTATIYSVERLVEVETGDKILFD